MGKRKKACPYCVGDASVISYQNIDVLKMHVMEGAGWKIVPSRISGACCQHQRRLAKAILWARELSLLPYCSHADA